MTQLYFIDLIVSVIRVQAVVKKEGLGSNEVQALRYNTSLLTKVLFTCTSLLFRSTFFTL